MEDVTLGMDALFKAKAARRRSLAALSFPDKVAAVVKLQEMAAPILQARGRAVRPWQIVPVAPVVQNH